MGLAWSSAKFTLLFQVTSKCYRLSHQRTCRNLSVSLAVVPSCHLSAFHPTTSRACLNSFHAPYPLSLLWGCTPWLPIKVHPNICVAENLIWSSNWQKTDMELGRRMGGKHMYSMSVTQWNVRRVSSPCKETLLFSLVHLLLSAFPAAQAPETPSQLPCPRSLSLSCWIFIRNTRYFLPQL